MARPFFFLFVAPGFGRASYVITALLRFGDLMSKKSILMIVGDYVEDYEVMVPFQALFAPLSTISKVIRPTPKRGGTISR